jgi:SAM-dependent methyltransferase
MQAWGDGYVTDVEYSDGFYPAQAPAQMALAATINALETPDTTGAYAYCELGCGRGDTSLVLAALNPRAEFHAVDFHPAHIAHAVARARAARLENITFHELSFQDLVGPAAPPMPMFDFITLHGVWTWVGPEVQAAILAFLRTRLKPGGLVYVGFNALPGWSDVAPIQRLLMELAADSPGRSLVAIERAIHTLERLSGVKALPARFEPAVEQLQKALATGALSYLSHEYFNEHWRPVYHADVARAFAGVKLTYAASTDLLNNFHNMALTDAQRTLLAQIDSPELRETLKDFCGDERFRRDVYVRGARRISSAQREGRLATMRLVLLRPPPELIQIARPDGSIWRTDPAAYGLILGALREGPKSVGDLLALPELAADCGVTAVELVGVLAGTAIATPYVDPSPESLAGATRLNALLDADPSMAMSRGGTVAVAALGLALPLTSIQFSLYATLRAGDVPDPGSLAAAFVRRCREGGGHPVIDGRVIVDEIEARAVVAQTYEQMIERAAPIWRTIGLV